MKDAVKLAQAYQILTGPLDAEKLWQQLDAVYEDGYMDNLEEGFLKAVSERGGGVFGGIEVRKDAKDLAAKILQKKIYSRKQYERFANREKISNNPTLHFLSEGIEARLESLTPLENGGFVLYANLLTAEAPLKIKMDLPDREGDYPGNSCLKTGSEDPLSSSLKKAVALAALQNAYWEKPNQEILEGLDALTRVGEESGQNGGEAFRCRKAETSGGEDLISLLSKRIPRSKESARKTEIRGIEFRGAMNEGIREKIEKALARYPDYVIKAIAHFKPVVQLFDPNVVYPPLIDSGLLLEPPQDNLSWTVTTGWVGQLLNVRLQKGGIIFLNTRGIRNGLTHELAHFLLDQVPLDIRILPRESFDGDSSSGLRGLYEEAKSRVRHFPEDAFVTPYQAVSEFEYSADGMEVFYRNVLSDRHTGTREELKKEDPLLYLSFRQMDFLLQRSFGSEPSNNVCNAPPFWVPFTETGIHHAKTYLGEKGAEWDNERNLDIFLSGTLDLDITEEARYRSLFNSPIHGSFRERNKRLLAAVESLAQKFSTSRFFQKQSEWHRKSEEMMASPLKKIISRKQ